MFSLLGFALLSLALPSLSLADHTPHRRHASIAARHNATSLERRGESFDNARLTYYAVGLGACGKNNVASDYIVALNSPQYGSGYPGPNCFRPIAITCNGKTLHATIMDECPGCPYGGLDLSQGLFEAFADTSVGVLTASWKFTDDGGEEPAPTSTWTPPKTTHKTPKPTPTSTWEWTPPVTLESKTTEKTSSTTKESSSSSSKKTSSTTHTTTSSSISIVKAVESSSTTSTSTTPKTTSTTSTSTTSATPTPTGPNALEKAEQAFVGLAALVVAAEAA